MFPGDTPFQRSVAMDFKRGDHLELSSIQTTLHIGAHADAPSHYSSHGKSIEECPLETYFGLCQVIDLSSHNGEITIEKLLPIEIITTRILFKTQSFQNIHRWQTEFSYLSKELVEFLATKKVKLIGIDTPSMDHSQSQTLETHQAFYRHQIAILEGLILDQIQAGIYGLAALPLKIKGGEASPVRAVLFDRDMKLI